MAQIEFTGLTRNWKPFATIVGTVDADTTYHIQNRGFDTLVLLEADSEPTDATYAGVLVLPNCVAIYKKGTQNLYCRAFNQSCSINVTSEE